MARRSTRTSKRKKSVVAAQIPRRGPDVEPPDAPVGRSFGPASCPKPVFRRLRGYAFDPSLSVRLDTAVVNEITYRVPWEEPGTELGSGKESKAGKPSQSGQALEKESENTGLMRGPVGEYLEVVDYDPASECFYEPVDLCHPDLLAQDGLPPSEGNPQFHQQMVYAVAMTTIGNFERALGRRALWARSEDREDPFVQRLRVYPHALREANAYYSPKKCALLFGYFPASSQSPDRYLPGGTVFTCLSHDIVAHETTHALLDGMHRRFIEANHHDALAFHEAFADIVALFQHFTFPEVLRHQIARTRGDLAAQNLLGELALEFGEAIGNRGALRSAIGEIDETTKEWRPHKPDPDEYRTLREPHARGSLLVAAVFDAFLAIYRMRVADLLRIATSGTGVLPKGELHPDLVNRLADEAAKTAQHVLHMCIRALDYCPPMDVDFGDYLRAIITADFDLVPDDDLGYRIAFIEAFRRRGIYPRDVRAMSVASLRWPLQEGADYFRPLAEKLRSIANDFRYLSPSRKRVFKETERISGFLNDWITDEDYRGYLSKFEEVTGIAFEFKSHLPGLRKGHDKHVPAFQISALRPAWRVGPDGDTLNQLIISMIQTRIVNMMIDGEREKIKFRGGCTLVLDLDSMQLRYAIKKDIADKSRLQRLEQYRRDILGDGSLRSLYFKQLTGEEAVEPLAMLHRSLDEGRP